MDWLAWTEGAVIRLTTIVVTIFLGIILAKLLGKITKHVLEQAEINRLLRQSGVQAIDERIAKIVEYTIYAFAMLLILQELGLTRIVLGILIIAAAIVLTATILLAIRNFIPNMIHGPKVKKEYKDKIGKTVKIGSVKGKLLKIGIIQSVVSDREKHYITHTYTIRQLQAN